MKLRLIQISSFILRWLLAVALTLSPLMAQEQSTSRLKIALDKDGATNKTFHASDNSLVGSSILSALPPRPSGASASAFQAPSPGRSYGTIIGILIGAGAAAAVLVLSGGEKNTKSTPVIAPVGPVGTVITAGTPTVNPPSDR